MRRVLILLAAVFSLIGTGYSQQPGFRETLRAKADPNIPVYQPVNELSGNLVSIDSEWMDDLMDKGLQLNQQCLPGQY